MSSSRANGAAGRTLVSPVNSKENFAATPLFRDLSTEIPGALDDSNTVRGLLVDAIRKSGKSREHIAEAMSFALNREITVRQINAWTAESREDYRFPAEYDRAFCYATGDDRLLRVRAELAGYRVITATEFELLELGRQYLIRQRANEKIAAFEKRLGGIDL